MYSKVSKTNPPTTQSNVCKNQTPPSTQKLCELHEFLGDISAIAEILLKINKEMIVSSFLDIS